MSNHFAQNLKKLRHNAGKTQAEAADLMIVNRATLAAWEEGRAEPKYNMLIAIAGFYKITTDELLKDEL